jgi:hypothetical protein
MKTKKKTIMLVASVSFYDHVLEIEKQLVDLGFSVNIPYGAVKLKRFGIDPNIHKDAFISQQNWKEKNRIILLNFKKILASDYLLVINDEKRNQQGYIGGNVLMEMTLAMHYKKPIYILNAIDETAPIKEEIYGMLPVVINGDLKKIK